jgi:type IV pilus assembly protein PilN
LRAWRSFRNCRLVALEVVHLFDELARTTPEGVQLTDLQQTDRTIAITGIAQSNARVSVYMRNLDLSSWFPGTRPANHRNQAGGKKKIQTIKSLCLAGQTG